MEEEGLAATEKEHHSCGPDCDCEELNRVRLRAACTDQNTHKIMCYMGNRTVTEFIQITILITGFFKKKELCIKSVRDSNNGTKKEVRALRKEVIRLQEKLATVEKDAKVCRSSVVALFWK